MSIAEEAKSKLIMEKFLADNNGAIPGYGEESRVWTSNRQLELLDPRGTRFRDGNNCVRLLYKSKQYDALHINGDYELIDGSGRVIKACDVVILTLMRPDKRYRVMDPRDVNDERLKNGLWWVSNSSNWEGIAGNFSGNNSSSLFRWKKNNWINTYSSEPDFVRIVSRLEPIILSHNLSRKKYNIVI